MGGKGWGGHWWNHGGKGGHWGDGYHGHHWDQHGRGGKGGSSWREGSGRRDWGPPPPWPGSGRGGSQSDDDIGEGQERVFGEQRVACLTSDQLVLEDRNKRLSYHLHSVVDEADKEKDCETCCLVVFLHGMGQSEWRLGEHEVRCGVHRRLRAAAPSDWRGNQTTRTLLLELSLHSKSDSWVAGWGVTCDGDEEGSWAANSDYDWAFLDVLKDTVKQVQERYWAVYSVLMGQSLGGQGAMLLGGYCVEMFQAVVVIAGYPVGAISPCPLQDQVHRRMRQYAHDNYMWFLRRFVGHLATGPLFIVVHALSDMKSSFADMAGCAEWASKDPNGQCEFVVVPDRLANSDYDDGYSRSGHAYIKCTLVEGPPSDQVYGQIALGMASVG